MPSTNRAVLVCSAVTFVAGLAAGAAIQSRPVAHAQTANRIFELRTYTAPDGKLEDLHARFRDHTTRLFEKQGMTNIGYWRPIDAPLSSNTLVYLLAYPSREAAKKSWDAFRQDPDWQTARERSEANGRIVTKVDSVFLEPTDYSRMK